MTRVLEAVRSEGRCLWKGFVAVYMFGSAVECALPDDVDLLLVHEDDIEWERVGRAKARIVKALGTKLHGLDVHVTTLGMTELTEAGMLELVQARQIFSEARSYRKSERVRRRPYRSREAPATRG